MTRYPSALESGVARINNTENIQYKSNAGPGAPFAVDFAQNSG